MTALLLAVGAASLLGSAHCAGMCGPLMLLSTEVVQIGPAARPPRWAYHSGRLLAYAVLGAVAGLLGATLDLGAAASGLGRLSAVLAALGVMACGFAAMFRAAGPALPAWLGAMQRRLGSAFAALPVRRRAFGMGLLSALLPCGWLYAFAAVAAGTGAPLAGVAVMLVFWAGTVPALAVVGLGARRFAVKYPALRFASAAIVASVGMAVAANRLHADFRGMKPHGSAEAALAHATKGIPPCCR